MNTYKGIHIWEGIWGKDTCIIDNTIWKPWTPIEIRIKPNSLVAEFEPELELCQHEMKCVNVHNINETCWMSAKDFKIGMQTKLDINAKVSELESTIKMLKEQL